MEKIKEHADKKKFVVLIIYDIVDNKVRTKMVDYLSQYGVRVQKSAFEAYITRRQYNVLAQEASSLIDIGTDSLRMYLLFDSMSVQSWGIGNNRTEDVIIL